MVKKRGEPLLLPLPCCLPYAVQRLGHALPGLSTAIAAMIPFAAALVVGLVALVLLGSGGVGPAIIVVSAGFAVTLVADHFVRKCWRR